MPEPIRLRLRFVKTGRAVYISHLDLMRTMQRAFLRADCPLKYSEGFNPHPVMSILLPLGVGCASECELMDFALTEPLEAHRLPERLNAVLPEGLRALECYAGGRKVTELKWLSLTGEMEYDRGTGDALAEDLAAFFARDCLPVPKKSKKGMTETDIAPAIRSVSFRRGGNGSMSLSAVLSAQEPTLNPELLLTALRLHAPDLAPDYCAFTRRETLDREGKLFR